MKKNIDTGFDLEKILRTAEHFYLLVEDEQVSDYLYNLMFLAMGDQFQIESRQILLTQ